MHLAIAVAVTAVVCGALGYGFRGAIQHEIKAAGAEVKLGATEIETWALKLESGAAADVKAVAAAIRAKLAKL
ncbi:MAG: hypothetical protein ACRD4R_06720 [Candidatus Acidiferrales bacterium]